MNKMLSLAICLVCIDQASAANYTLSVASTNMTPGQQFKIYWSAPAGTPTTDWIGIYPETRTPSNYVFRATTSGSVTGSVTAELIVAQSYIIQYFQHGGYVAMTPPITVQVVPANDAYHFTVTPTSVDQDDQVVVSWNVATNINIANDQIGYYRVTTNSVTSVIQYVVLPPGFYSGSAWFTMFAPPGDYAFQWFKHGAPNATNAVLTPVVVHVAPAPATLSLRLLSQNQAGLSWNTKIGTVYTVMSTPGLTEPTQAWQTLTTVVGDGKTVLVPVPRTNDAGLYRLHER